MVAGVKPKVNWRKLFFGNIARPSAVFTLWMACKMRLPTKDMVQKIGIMTDGKCQFCDERETDSHLFFECETTKRIWKQVIDWFILSHEPKVWGLEVLWCSSKAKGKGHKAFLMKCVLAETIYTV